MEFGKAGRISRANACSEVMLALQAAPPIMYSGVSTGHMRLEEKGRQWVL